MFYSYNKDGTLTNKYAEQNAENTLLHSDIDFDLDCYNVIVGQVTNGEITYYTKTLKPVSDLVFSIQQLSAKNAELEKQMTETQVALCEIYESMEA